MRGGGGGDKLNNTKLKTELKLHFIRTGVVHFIVSSPVKSFRPRPQLVYKAGEYLILLNSQPQKVHFYLSVSPHAENECCKCHLAYKFVGGRLKSLKRKCLKTADFL